jgi:hypothetical protein
MDIVKLSVSLGVHEYEILDTLASMSKNNAEFYKVDCGGCGFNTCEQMVVAIILGMRVAEDCVCTPTRKQESISEQHNEDLASEMRALLDLIDLKEIEALQLMEVLTKCISELKASRKTIEFFVKSI